MRRNNSLSVLFVILLLVLLTQKEATAADSKNNSNFTTSIDSLVTLNDGHSFPIVGLGVSLTYEFTYGAVQSALAAGYRNIDTAAEEETYGNEDMVGQAIRDYRQEKKEEEEVYYVTTKLWDDSHGFYETLEAFDESYEALGLNLTNATTGSNNATSFIRLVYLMHSPFGGHILESYDAMLYLKSKGLVQSIGVSNFGLRQLRALQDFERPMPTINQIELHPLNYQQRLPLIEWCRAHDIYLQAYGSLMHGYTQWLQDALLLEITERYPGKTSAQILLRWALQHDFLIIPKSSHEERIQANAQLYDFELSDADMELLDHFGDHVQWESESDAQEQRNIYKEDWNWNPVDEAPVHLGETDYWPDFEGVDEVWFAEDSDSEDGDDYFGGGGSGDDDEEEEEL